MIIAFFYLVLNGYASYLKRITEFALLNLEARKEKSNFQLKLKIADIPNIQLNKVIHSAH